MSSAIIERSPSHAHITLLLLLVVLALSACRPTAGDGEPPVEPTTFDDPAAVIHDGLRVTSSDFEWDGYGEAVDIRGDVALVGASEWNYFGDGYAYVYRRRNGVWQEEAQLAASDRNRISPREARGLKGQRFGSDVALGEGILAVGAPGTNPDFGGAVYIYEYDGHSWLETARLVPEADGSEAARPEADWLVYGRMPRRTYGQLVALHGDTLAVGGDAYARAVTIFQRENGIWQQDATLNIPARQNSDLYMASMDLYGDTLALSAYYVRHEQPPQMINLLLGDVVVYVYERRDGSWQETLQHIPDGDAPLYMREARIGAAVALEGSNGQAARLAIGLPGFPELSAIADLRDAPFFTGTGEHEEAIPGFPPSPHQVGTVAIFEREAGGAWQQQAVLTPDTGEGLPRPGFAFATDPATVASQYQPENLARMVFPGHMYSSDPAVTFFGATVDLDANRLAVTSGFANTTHVFEQQEDGAWRYQARIQSDDGAVTEDYAQIVAISGDSVLLGTPGEFGNSAVFFHVP